MSEYSFQRITDQNLSTLIPLALDAFGMNLSLDYLRKKFDTSWCGVKNIGYIAVDSNGIAVAYYGIFPCFIKHNGNILLAAQSGDTMTHSQHRGKGLFVTLAKMTYQLAKENGVQIVFGFPNKNSYPGFVNKLNWVHKEDMHLYKIKVTTLPLAKLAHVFKKFSPLYLGFVKLFLLKNKSIRTYFNNPNISESFGGIVRDENYFNYKTYYKKYFLEILGVSVWIKIEGYLIIGDIEKTDEEKFNKVLKKIKQLSFWIGASEILFQASPNSYLDNLLSKKYSYQKGVPIGYVSFNSNIDGSKLKFTAADFDTF